MINRFLSMNPYYIDLVNQLQVYTISTLKQKEVYKLYVDLIPKKKVYLKYIKNKAEDKYSNEMLSIMTKYFELGKKDIIDYLDILVDTDNGIETVNNILRMYGKADKEIKKIWKLK